MIDRVIRGGARAVGNFAVARLLPVLGRRTVGPFVFFDHMGPARLAAGEGFDVAPHPHVGLSTVTYLLDGEIVHRDSIGSVQSIHPGEVNLMTAGRGVVHSERSPPEARAAGPSIHGLQLWLGLPAEREEDAPSFEHHADVPAVTRAGFEARVLMGQAFGVASPIDHPARPLFVDARLEAGATLAAPEVAELAAYVIAGAVTVDGVDHGERQLLVRAANTSLAITATAPSRIVLIGGPPLGERRYLDWNFVSSRPERLEVAKDDWRAGRFPIIAGDDAERIPYPERPHGQRR